MKVREFLNTFVPYAWEPSSEELAKQVGKSTEEMIRLDTNTSPYPPLTWLTELSKTLLSLNVNNYPDTSYLKLRSVIADYCDCNVDEILVSNGADEALSIITNTLIDSRSQAIISTPTYSYFAKLVQISSGKIIGIRRKDDFSDDFDAINSAVERDTRMVILCSPNNPTGNVVDKSQLKELLSLDFITVIIDEAYFEYSGDTATDLMNSYENLIVVRTLSKAFSLAGLRVGYALSSKKTISLLNMVRPPNSVGIIAQKLGEIALQDLGWMRKNVTRILDEKNRVVETINKMDDVEVIPSRANFMLLRFRELSGSQAYAGLLDHGVVVRDVSDMDGLPNCIRFNIGTRKQNDKLIDALTNIST